MNLKNILNEKSQTFIWNLEEANCLIWQKADYSLCWSRNRDEEMYCKGKYRNFFELIEMFYILILVAATTVCTFVTSFELHILFYFIYFRKGFSRTLFFFISVLFDSLELRILNGWILVYINFTSTKLIKS